jgi:hypothetical protein
VALTVEEKQRTRYHTGYPSVQSAAALSYGMVKPLQTLFLLESAMNLILPAAEDKLRSILGILDGIECRLVDAQDRMAAKSVDNLTMRPDETAALEEEYRRWANRLADVLGVPLYGYSLRFHRQGAAFAGSIPVME